MSNLAIMFGEKLMMNGKGYMIRVKCRVNCKGSKG